LLESLIPERSFIHFGPTSELAKRLRRT
jgi:hypothetical protein